LQLFPLTRKEVDVATSKFVRYKLTGMNARNGCESTIPLAIIWPNILALQGLKLVLSVVSDHHQEEYFEIIESAYPGVADYLSTYGEVEEVTADYIDQIKKK